MYSRQCPSSLARGVSFSRAPSWLPSRSSLRPRPRIGRSVASEALLLLGLLHRLRQLLLVQILRLLSPDLELTSGADETEGGAWVHGVAVLVSNLQEPEVGSLLILFVSFFCFKEEAGVGSVDAVWLLQKGERLPESNALQPDHLSSSPCSQSEMIS